MTEDEMAAFAGEYVLGLLDDQALADAAALRATDGRFDAAVATWERQLAPLLDDAAPVMPPPRVWERLRVATLPTIRRPRSWRRAFGGFAALAAVAAGVVLLAPWRPAPPRTLAQLTLPGRGMFTVAQVAYGTLVTPRAVQLPAGKTAELWLITPGHAPVALGLLDPAHSRTLASLANAGGAELAVSLEPPGGSPTGLPTGPVVAESIIAKL